MKRSFVPALGLSALLLPAISFAASVNLYNGGLGQPANNVQNFGVAVCNGGASAVNQSVPVSITASGRTAAILSASSIQPGKCEYSYLSYAQLGLQAGGSYAVMVTIDPQRTLVANANNQTVYNVTVPGGGAQAGGLAANRTANVSTQSSNFFQVLASWFVNLFR